MGKGDNMSASSSASLRKQFWDIIRENAEEQRRTGKRWSCDPDYVAMVHQNDVAYPKLQQHINAARSALRVRQEVLIFQFFDTKCFLLELPPMDHAQRKRLKNGILKCVPNGFGYKIAFSLKNAPEQYERRAR